MITHNENHKIFFKTNIYSTYRYRWVKRSQSVYEKTRPSPEAPIVKYLPKFPLANNVVTEGKHKIDWKQDCSLSILHYNCKCNKGMKMILQSIFSHLFISRLFCPSLNIVYQSYFYFLQNSLDVILIRSKVQYKSL